MRTLLPNLITLLALCAGLTGVRLAIEGKLEWAVAAIVFAAMLDGIDGRVARMLKGTSRFGAELDSLADFFNFGVAPALILYFWGLHELGHAGWIAAMVFAICAGLRLARFNVMIDDPNRPAWAGELLCRHAGAGGAHRGAAADLCDASSACRGSPGSAPLVFLYTLAIAFLMVSRLPVFSGKRVGKRVAPEMVLPVFVAGGGVLRAADRLSVGGAHHRHARLSREPAVRLHRLSQLRAGGCRRRRGRQPPTGGDASALRPNSPPQSSMSPTGPGRTAGAPQLADNSCKFRRFDAGGAALPS